MKPRWFLFDLGNVLIRLAYPRVLAVISESSTIGGEELHQLLEGAGGYRDLERGVSPFSSFHHLLQSRAGYRGSLEDFRAVWSDFFEGPVERIEEVLDRVRREYRVAFLSNSNEVHAEAIPRAFPQLFREGEPFIFSHVERCSKPERRIYQRAMEILGTRAEETVFVDDLAENVKAAQAFGMRAYQFTTAAALLAALEEDGLLARITPA